MAGGLTGTMRAERFYADTKKIAVEDVPIPEPGPGEVLVKVAFCGICHSDLSLINGTFPAQVPVVTQGHEASGTIAALGARRNRVGRGRPGGGRGRPALPGVRELSPWRRRELPADPADGVRLRRRLGGVHRRAGRRVDPGARQRSSGAGRHPGRCGVDAVRRGGAHRKVGIGETVGVWGVGGVGTHIVQLARLVGAVPVIAVDIKPAVLDRALELGRRLRVRLPRRAAEGQDRRDHRRPQTRCGVRCGRPQGDVRAGVGLRDRRRPTRRGRA